MAPVNPPPSLRHLSTRFHPQRAFSLIEVVLAVGVVAFAFVALLGLLPASMGQFRQAIDTSVCAQIAQRVINDAQQTDFNILIDEKNIGTNNDFAFRMPTVADTKTNPGKCVRYFDEQGNEVIPEKFNTTNVFGSGAADAAAKARVIYMVNTRVLPRTSLPTPSTIPTYLPHLATLTIQVAYNPGFFPINLSNAVADSNDPTRMLWIKTEGVSVINYCAQIGRN